MDKETVYIVSGYMRTGTSMMMKALESGGMETFYRKSRDDFRKGFADENYDPNTGGLYEIERKDVTDDFPEKFKGKLIKCLMDGLHKVQVMPKIKVVFMRRDFEEIRQSYQAFFSNPLQLDEKKFIDKTERAISMLLNRKDVELTILNYRDVIKNPMIQFTKLYNNEWPINPIECSKVVNPELYRFQKENLIKGIS